MKFAFLGFGSKNCMSVRLSQEMERLGHEVRYIDTLNYAMHYCLRRMRQPDYVPLDTFLKGFPLTLKELYVEFSDIDHFDVVFIEQANLRFKNDLDEDTLVIYYHRDILGTFNVLLPDLLLYRFKELELFLSVNHRQEWYFTPYKARLLNGIHLPEYSSTKKKMFKGLVWIGPYKPLEFYMEKDVLQFDYYERTHEWKELAKREGLLSHCFDNDVKIPFEVYKHVLERSEAVLIVPGRNAYVTRKCYEAAATRTIIVLWVQNERAARVYDEWGLKDGVNCFLFRTKDDLRKIVDVYLNDDALKARVLEGAMEWVQNHTYEVRARQLLQLIDKIKEIKKEEMIKVGR